MIQIHYNHKCSKHGLWGHTDCTVPDSDTAWGPCPVCTPGNIDDGQEWEYEDSFAMEVKRIRKEAGIHDDN